MLPISQIRVSKAVLDILKLFVHKGFLGRWINLAYYFENDIPIGSDSTLFHAITAFCFIFLFDRFVVLQWIDVYSFTRAALIETGFYTKTLYGNNQIIINIALRTCSFKKSWTNRFVFTADLLSFQMKTFLFYCKSVSNC